MGQNMKKKKSSRTFDIRELGSVLEPEEKELEKSKIGASDKSNIGDRNSNSGP